MAVRPDQGNKTPSKRIQERSAKMRAELLQVFRDFEKVIQMRVYPDEPEKAVRIVCFHFEAGSDFRIDCYEEKSLKNCPANKFRDWCSHVETAVRQLLEETKGETQ